MRMRRARFLAVDSDQKHVDEHLMRTVGVSLVAPGAMDIEPNGIARPSREASALLSLKAAATYGGSLTSHTMRPPAARADAGLADAVLPLADALALALPAAADAADSTGAADDMNSRLLAPVK
jgi:hypothetical protein